MGYEKVNFDNKVHFYKNNKGNSSETSFLDFLKN